MIKCKSTNRANFICVTKLDGTGTAGQGELAFIAPYMVGMMVDAANQSVLNSTYDWVINTGINNFTYFHNTIKMLCLLTVSGNYWSPSISTGIDENPAASSSVFAAAIIQHSDEIILNIQSDNNLNASIMIYDESGKQVFNYQGILINGYNNILFSTENIKSGLHIISINTDADKKTIKFIK